MPNIRGITTQWTGGDTSAEVELPECEEGDQLLIFVGGGNKVTNVPTGWFFQNFLTGQEAQGIVYDKPAEPGDSGSTVTINFDGTDQRFIVVVAVLDYMFYEGNHAIRSGTAGSTFTPTVHNWTADAYQGDLIFTFAFVRNGATPPTLDRGVLWHSEASDGSSAVLYVESAAAYEAGSAWGLSLPSRSGYVVYQFVAYQFAWLDEWVQGSDYVEQVSGIQPFTEIGARAGVAARSQSGSFPVLTQSDFIDLPLEWEVNTLLTEAARWSIGSSVDGTEFTITWDVNQKFWFYGYRIPAANRQPIDDPGIPPDAIQWEYDADGSSLVGIEAELFAADNDYDDTAGFVQGVQDPEFVTVVVPIDSMEWDTPTDSGLPDDWAGDLGQTDDPLYERPHTPPHDEDEDAAIIIDLTGAIRDSENAEVQFATFVAGPSGWGVTEQPSVDLHVYGTSGSADFGATMRIGDYFGTFRPPLRRDRVRRTPPVVIRPPYLAYVRQFPTAHTGTWGGTPRIFPPPKVQRIIGGHR